MWIQLPRTNSLIFSVDRQIRLAFNRWRVSVQSAIRKHKISSSLLDGSADSCVIASSQELHDV